MSAQQLALSIKYSQQGEKECDNLLEQVMLAIGFLLTECPHQAQKNLARALEISKKKNILIDSKIEIIKITINYLQVAFQEFKNNNDTIKLSWLVMFLETANKIIQNCQELYKNHIQEEASLQKPPKNYAIDSHQAITLRNFMLLELKKNNSNANQKLKGILPPFLELSYGVYISLANRCLVNSTTEEANFFYEKALYYLNDYNKNSSDNTEMIKQKTNVTQIVYALKHKKEEEIKIAQEKIRETLKLSTSIEPNEEMKKLQIHSRKCLQTIMESMHNATPEILNSFINEVSSMKETIDQAENYNIPLSTLQHNILRILNQLKEKQESQIKREIAIASLLSPARQQALKTRKKNFSSKKISQAKPSHSKKILVEQPTTSTTDLPATLPKKTPADIAIACAETSLKNNNIEYAIKFYNQALLSLPDTEVLLKVKLLTAIGDCHKKLYTENHPHNRLKDHQAIAINQYQQAIKLANTHSNILSNKEEIATWKAFAEMALIPLLPNHHEKKPSEKNDVLPPTLQHDDLIEEQGDLLPDQPHCLSENYYPTKNTDANLPPLSTLSKSSNKNIFNSNLSTMDIEYFPLNLPPMVTIIGNTLIDAGYQCYLTGGAIRDHLLKITPADYDLVTSASLETVQEVLQEKTEFFAKIVGKAHPHLFVFNKENHQLLPIQISHLQSTLQADAQHRDFTINAMYWNFATSVLLRPLSASIKDMKDNNLRVIGNTAERIAHDPCLILRAVYFKTQLNFKWPSELQRTITSHKKLLTHVDPGKLLQQLEKFFTQTEAALIFNTLHKEGIASILFSEVRDFLDSPHFTKFPLMLQNFLQQAYIYIELEQKNFFWTLFFAILLWPAVLRKFMGLTEKSEENLKSLIEQTLATQKKIIFINDSIMQDIAWIWKAYTSSHQEIFGIQSQLLIPENCYQSLIFISFSAYADEWHKSFAFTRTDETAAVNRHSFHSRAALKQKNKNRRRHQTKPLPITEKENNCPSVTRPNVG